MTTKHTTATLDRNHIDSLLASKPVIHIPVVVYDWLMQQDISPLAKDCFLLHYWSGMCSRRDKLVSTLSPRWLASHLGATERGVKSAHQQMREKGLIERHELIARDGSTLAAETTVLIPMSAYPAMLAAPDRRQAASATATTPFSAPSSDGASSDGVSNGSNSEKQPEQDVDQEANTEAMHAKVATEAGRIELEIEPEIARVKVEVVQLPENTADTSNAAGNVPATPSSGVAGKETDRKLQAMHDRRTMCITRMGELDEQRSNVGSDYDAISKIEAEWQSLYVTKENLEQLIKSHAKIKLPGTTSKTVRESKPTTAVPQRAISDSVPRRVQRMIDKISKTTIISAPALTVKEILFSITDGTMRAWDLEKAIGVSIWLVKNKKWRTPAGFDAHQKGVYQCA